jgi:7-cyano-7-deazaguanine synthase
MTRLSSQPEVLILLSGGVDSAACLQIYSEMDMPICALFVDYGQPPASPELSSAHAIARYYSIQLTEAKWCGPSVKRAGLIPARNAFLISAALMECPSTVSGIVIGVHGGTDYPDCSRAFVAAMQGVTDLYENGAVQILAPLLAWISTDNYLPKPNNKFFYSRT